MSIISTDCPRCGIKKMVFSVIGHNHLGANRKNQNVYELFAVCNECEKATIFIILNRGVGGANTTGDNTLYSSEAISINKYFEIKGFVNLRNNATHSPPEFIPDNIKASFEEGAACLSIQCWNAAGAMFRQCLDLATKDKLPKGDLDGLKAHDRNYLAPRMRWLFENKIFPSDLERLADCIIKDGNDGTHDGTLTEAESMDLLDFTERLLERLYTEPARTKKAEDRRLERRKQQNDGKSEDQPEAKGE